MDKQNTLPLIVGFVADFMFTTRIENGARHAGFQIRWIERASDVGQTEANMPQETPGESLHGRLGQLFTQLADWQPALLLFDLNNQAVPWSRWIAALKSSPATRRMPIMCFGPHEDVVSMTAAKNAGADVVLARSRFTADMPALFQKYANVPNQNLLQETCQAPLSALAEKGLQLFNKGEYFECHEALEDAWQADASPGRELYRGILQVGIAYLQIERGNYRGAVKMLLRVRQWLDPLPDSCRGIDVAQLRMDAQRVHEMLLELGPERLSEFDQTAFKPVVYVV